MSTQLALAIVCTWSARLLGTLLAATIVVIGVGESLSEGAVPPFWESGRAAGMFLGVGLVVVGSLLGWRREALGGALAVGGWLLFNTINLATGGRPHRFPLEMGLPGLLYLAAALLRRGC